METAEINLIILFSKKSCHPLIYCIFFFVEHKKVEINSRIYVK